MKSPESRQFLQEHPHLSARNVLAATALAGAIAGFSPETAHADKVKAPSQSLVREGLSSITRLEEGYPLRVLRGRITLKKGAEVFSYAHTDEDSFATPKKSAEIQKNTITRPMSVTHAIYKKNDEGKKVLCFELGGVEPGRNQGQMCTVLSRTSQKIVDGNNKPLNINHLDVVKTEVEHVIHGHFYGDIPRDPFRSNDIEDKNFNLVSGSPLGAANSDS